MRRQPEEVENEIVGIDMTVPADPAAAYPDDVPPPVAGAKPTRFGSRTFRLLTGAIVFTAAGYVGYERFGTRANADRISHLESYGDEAVAIGLTDEQPGFLLLARLSPRRVSVDAVIQSNWLTGRQTLVQVHTPLGATAIRLRRPQVIMVREDGTVDSASVRWTLAEFDQLVHAADCATNCRDHPHRCGQPLDDVGDALATWPMDLVPQSLREFLKARTDVRPTPALEGRLDSKTFIERDGRRLLWAKGEPESPDAEWFDVTGSSVDPARFQHGIGKDTISTIDDPVFVEVDDARLSAAGINDESMVIGYVHRGVARAYPLKFLDQHELVNDRIAGKPITVGW